MILHGKNTNIWLTYNKKSLQIIQPYARVPCTKITTLLISIQPWFEVDTPEMRRRKVAFCPHQAEINLSDASVAP
jgi:hypothetical protein